MIGTSVDRYRILEELGHGGMSVVYRGMDAALEREVAVKVLHNHLAKKLENRKRFHREAKAIARLRHPNILEVYDFSSEDAEKSYIVMEYVEGANLREFLAMHGPAPAEIAALIGIEIALALGHAHDHGVIHRDLKPENIMVSGDGALKLMDFGIAHVIDAETMTQTGSLLGSPAHMSPEMIEGAKIDSRADIFALGTVLYWLTTGELPFRGTNAPQVLRNVLQGDFESPDSMDPRIGGRFGRIVGTCLARDPEDRYRNAQAIAKVLGQFAADVDLEEPKRELRRYFTKPASYVETFNETIAEKLLVRARTAHREKRTADAIASYNRVLAYEPENAEVQRYLDRVSMQRRAGSFALIAIIAAVVGYGVWAASANDPVDPTVPDVVAPVGDVVAVVEGAVPKAEETALAARSGLEHARHIVQRIPNVALDIAEARPIKAVNLSAIPQQRILVVPPAPDVGVAAAEPDMGTPTLSHRYRFVLHPAAATLFVDGRPVNSFAAATGIELLEGRHQLRATSPGAKPWHKTVDVRGPQANKMPIVLDWLPGRLQVVSNLSAVVWIEDRPMKRIGAQGKSATFTFPFGASDEHSSERIVALRVAYDKDMANPQAHKVTIRPGETVSLKVSFAKVEN